MSFSLRANLIRWPYKDTRSPSKILTGAILIRTIAVILMLTFAMLGQSATISGFVYDDSSGEALIGANVYLDGTQIGSSTNLSGYYAISGVPPGDYKLVIRFLGYVTFAATVALQADSEIIRSVRLKLTQLQMAPVTVTADAMREAHKLYDKPVSRVEITAQQLEKIPQVGETDLFRSLQTLPGIVSVSDYASAPYIRGGTPDQNLYLIDGADVYNPEHAFGIFSVFNTDAIKHVDVYKGGFGAEFGGRLSSIINVTHLDGNRERVQGSFGLSLLSARGVLQTPLGHNSSFSASFRRTYFDQTVARAIDDVPQYYFYDGNLKLFLSLNASNNLTVSMFGGRDVFDYTLNENALHRTLKLSWAKAINSTPWPKS